MTGEMNRTTLEVWIDRGLHFLLVFTPLAFGTVQAWSAAVMEIAAFLVFALWLLLKFREGGSEPRLPRVAFFLLLLVAVVALQVAPLPRAVLSLLSPETVRLYDSFAPGGPRQWLCISLYPGATIEELFKLLAYAAVFVVVLDRCRSKERVLALVRTIVLMGCFLSVFAFLQRMTWNGRLYWIYPVSERLQPSTDYIWGPYVNHNHFAGYLEIAIPLCLGLIFYHALRISLPLQPSLLRTVQEIMRSDRYAAISGYFLAAVVMAGALLGSLSRGGILGFAASVAVFVLLIRSRRSFRRRQFLLAAFGVVVATAIVAASWDRIEGRFGEIIEPDKIKRMDIWSDAAAIVRAFPLVGTGQGTFVSISPHFQTKHSTLLFEHAENDYLEQLTDTGLAGVSLLVMLMIIFFRDTVRNWRRCSRPSAKAVGAGGIAACVAIAVHSMTDFNMRIPANALLLTLVAAMTYAYAGQEARTE
jgi:hypothetical protein